MSRLFAWFDRFFERGLRGVAHRHGAAAWWPTWRGPGGRRGAADAAVRPQRHLPPKTAAAGGEGASPTPNDPAKCEYWRYCAIDGYLCTCCGGSTTQCRRAPRPRRSPGSAPA